MDDSKRCIMGNTELRPVEVGTVIKIRDEYFKVTQIFGDSVEVMRWYGEKTGKVRSRLLGDSLAKRRRKSKQTYRIKPGVI